MTPPSRGAGGCRDSPAARPTEGPPPGVPGPHRTTRCGVGRCSPLGPVVRDGSFPPSPRVLSGPRVRSSSPASLQGRSFPSLPVRDGSFPPALPFRDGSPASSSPRPSSRTPPLSFRAESFLLAFPQDQGHPLHSPQHWVLSLRLPSPQGRSLLPLPGSGGPFSSVRHPCVPRRPEGHRGPALLSGGSWLSRLTRARVGGRG